MSLQQKVPQPPSSAAQGVTSIAASGGGGDRPVKCGAVSCPMPQAILLTCSGPGCAKNVHAACYQRAILDKFKVDKLVDPVRKCLLYVCSKTCYNKVEKTIVNQPNRIPWDKDGKNGPEDPINSLSILLQWMLTEGNYNRFRGHDNGGKRKVSFGVQLSLLMKEKGCRVECSGEAVLKKIQEIESKFIKAHDWVNNNIGTHYWPSQGPIPLVERDEMNELSALFVCLML